MSNELRMLFSSVRLRSGLSVLIAIVLVAGFWRQSPIPTQASPAAAPPYLVVIVMDGFRPDYMNLAPMHHLRGLMAQGRSYDTAWVGQIESETPSGHATIATGAYPRKTGIIGFAWRDRSSGTFTFMPTNLGQIEAGALTQTVEQGGVPTLSDLVHQRDRNDLAVSISGEKLWASAPMGVGADYVLYGKEVPIKKGQVQFRPFAVRPNLPPARSGYTKVSAPSSAFEYQDGFAARLAVQLVKTLRPRVLLLNLPAPDIAGHYYGGISDPKDMRPILRSTDYAIGQVVDEYKHLGLMSKTVFVITADHGMASGTHRVQIHSIYDAVRKAPVTQLDQELRNSVGSIWLKDPEHAGLLANALAADHFSGVEGALYKVPDGSNWKFVPTASTAAKLSPALLKAYLDLADTEASPMGADILLPYGENTNGLPPTHRFSGMHGGFSWGAQHIPLVIVGPGVKPGTSHFPAKLADIAPTIERLIGLKIPSAVDGVVLADALTDATPAEQSAQQVVASDRSADVKALEAHSIAQSK